jgi:transposase
MAKALSNDLRSRVIAAVAGGASRRSAAVRFGVSPSAVVKWVQRWQSTGSPAAMPMGGDRRSHRLEAHSELILGTVGAKPDITVRELQALLAGHRVKASYGAVWNLLNRHGLTFKKDGSRCRAGARRRRRGPAEVA